MPALAAASLLAAPAAAQRRTVMEGLAVSHNILYIDTVTPRVSIGTLTYTGGVANTALWVSSNVVISSGPTGSNNFIVLYATGSICLNGTCVTTLSGGGGGGGGTTNYWIFQSSMESTNSSRVSIDSRSFVFDSSFSYKFDWYMITPSSSAVFFVVPNCKSGGDNTTTSNFSNHNHASNNLTSPDGSGAAPYGLPLVPQFANNQKLGNTVVAKGWFEMAAYDSTTTVRILDGHAAVDNMTGTFPAAADLGEAYWQDPTKAWRSVCFDLSSGYYNFAIDYTRSWAKLKVTVWKSALKIVP